MTLEEIQSTIKTTEDKLSEVKEMLDDLSNCKSEKSKTLILAAASKMVEQFKPVVTVPR